MFRNAIVVLVLLASVLNVESVQLQLSAAKETTEPAKACAALKNMGSHSTVRIQVGTPVKGTDAQVFDVVADTGSDSVIIPSCSCVANWRCSPDDKCFTGSNRSSTFKMFMKNDSVQSVRITFGSGPIDAVLASDVVKVGKVKAFMKDSVLLMVDKQLDISGPFEGILGLGLPSNTLKQDYGDGYAMPVAFLEATHTTRFSLCFNAPSPEGVLNDGALRLDAPLPKGTTTLGSIGQLHWGLDFREFL